MYSVSFIICILTYLLCEFEGTPEWNVEPVAVEGNVILLSQQTRAGPLPSAGNSPRQMQHLFLSN